MSDSRSSAEPSADSVRVVSLPSNDIILNPGDGKIYASVPSSAGPTGNSIAVLDPMTGAVAAPVFVGSEPSRLALSPDGQRLFVHLAGAYSIGTFDLGTRTLTGSFSVGNDQFYGPYSISSISVSPTEPSTLALARYWPQVSPSQAGVAIFKDGERLTQTGPGHSAGAISVAYGATGTTLFASNSYGVYSMPVNSTGVGTATNSIPGSNPNVSIKVVNGVIYTSSGQLIDGAAGTLIGTFPNASTSSQQNAFAIDPSVNRAYYLVRNQSGQNTVDVRAYDMTTFTLIGSLSIPNVTGEAGSLIRWGTNGLAFRTTNNQVYLVQTSLIPTNDPLPDPPPVPTITPTPTPTYQTFVRRITVPSNDMAHNPATNELLLSVPGNAGFGLGNTITHIDLASGTVGPSVFIGSEPNKIAVGNDGQTLYAALHGASAIRRYNIATRTAGTQIQTGPIFQQPRDIAVMPGYPDTIAVATNNNGVHMFDSGVQRTEVSRPVNTITSLAFSSVSNILYGYNAGSSGYEMTKYTAWGNTLTGEMVGRSLLVGGQTKIAFSGGRIYSNSGRVVDPETRRISGTFPGTGSAMAVDAAQRKIFYIEATTLTAYDMDTYLKIGSVTLPAYQGMPVSMVRWGANGLAVRSLDTWSGNAAMIQIIYSTLVAPSGAVPSGLQFGTTEFAANENNGSVSVEVTRTGDIQVTSTVSYATADGTALAGSDYVAQSGTLTFNPGESSKIITIQVNNENVFEDTETFSVSLSNAGGGAFILTPSTANVRITNDDPRPWISIAGATVPEPRMGNSGSVSVSLQLTNPSHESISVNYATANGSAVAGSDYTAKTGVVTFAPGQVSQAVIIDVLPDNNLEAPETFSVNITGASNAYIQNNSANVVIQNTITRAARFDYDGDGRSDLSVFRPSNGYWHLLRGNAGYTNMEWGVATDRPVPADYDNDGKTDVAVFRPSEGKWYLFRSGTQSFDVVSWGESGDVPLPADHDGDRKADLVVYRPSDNNWYRLMSGSGSISVASFGAAGDRPVTGDFDRDGLTDVAIFRPSENNWYIAKSADGYFVQTWGEAGDVPAPADFDGDGQTDLAVFRPSTGQWFIAASHNGQVVTYSWGANGDVPVPADYDGDNRSDPGVFRPSEGMWYIVNSTAGIQIQQFGQNGDVPTQSSFIY